MMAANAVTSMPERHNKWYQDDVTEVNEPIRKLLESYSKVPSDKVVEHVNTIVSILALQAGSIRWSDPDRKSIFTCFFQAVSSVQADR